MIRFRLLGLLLLAATSAAHAHDAGTVLSWSLLTDTDTSAQISGAKAVAQDPTPDRATLDLVAELLAERSAVHQGGGQDVDAAAWLAKALAAGHDARYRPLVEQALAVYANKKLDEHGALALAQMTGASSEPFARGTVDLAALRAELAAERKAMTGTGASLATFVVGTPVQAVLEALGFPADVTERVESRKAGVVSFRVRSVRLVYPGQGMVDIGSPAGGWEVVDVWPNVPNQAPAYSGQFPDDAALLMTSDPMVLVKLAGKLRRRGEREPALLDRVAERLRVSMGTEDEYEASALAHLSHLLADSGDRRYVDVLRAASTRAPDHRLKGHAGESLKQLEGG
jgi:hypothetical protein